MPTIFMKGRATPPPAYNKEYSVYDHQSSQSYYPFNFHSYRFTITIFIGNFNIIILSSIIIIVIVIVVIFTFIIVFSFLYFINIIEVQQIPYSQFNTWQFFLD